MPFPIKKPPHPKKTLRRRRLQKKYHINRSELDSLTPHSPYDESSLSSINYFPPHNRSSPVNPYMGQNTRRNSQVSSQSTTPLINHTTGSPVINLASLHSLPGTPVVRSPRGGRTRKQVRRSRGRGGTRRGRGYRRPRGLTRRVTRGQNRNQRSSSNSANSAIDNSDSERSNASTPDIPYTYTM